MTSPKSNTETKHDEDTIAFFNELEEDHGDHLKTCSASQAFNSVWQCYTLGSQALNYYRYGSKKDCSAKYEDFKFCLTTKTKTSKVADAMIRKREEEKRIEKEKQRSSEDVWELRV
ncbi:uncharacterized protein BX664DRAFT_284090 [Halteromyces radiatus]|uniref:uncharacterized protein n=1 Tax=Halteromyces radiatus TaxID=101107 RepID=UPI00221E5B7F|nr:uncharacterized protein BX664DRAFT_284090 [Halteromyces radiatus]KAI8085079.1 hypothetical protein BX664DRAFT_284090 [Halteromyces radiatus]